MKLEKLNTVVTAAYTTRAPATNVKHAGASMEIARNHGAASKAARAYVTVMEAGGTAFGRAKALLESTRVKINALGLPLKTGGLLLPIVHLEKVQDIYDVAERDLVALRAEIMAEHPDQLRLMRARLGSLADTITLPPASAVAAGFHHALVITAPPALVTESALGAIAEDIRFRTLAESRESVAGLVKGSYAAPVREVLDEVVAMATSLREGKRFRGERVDALRESLVRLAGLNVFEMADVDRIVADLAPVANATREEVANGRGDVLVKLDKAETNINSLLQDIGF